MRYLYRYCICCETYKKIEVERRRIEIIERKIAREDKDRERERDVFKER